jgi:hypothetical protein
MRFAPASIEQPTGGGAMSEEARRKARNPRTMKAGRKGVEDRGEQSAADRSRRTAGENRDFDDSGESKNQGHGHPREERGGDRRS